MTTTTACLWCGAPIVRSGRPGRPRKFCRRTHRQRYHEAQMYDQMITLAMVIAAHGPNCNVCDQVVDLLTDEPGLGPSLDHVIPRSRGGRHTLDNLRVCHHRCNSFKRDRALSEVRGQAPATGGDEVAPRLF